MDTKACVEEIATILQALSASALLDIRDAIKAQTAALTDHTRAEQDSSLTEMDLLNARLAAVQHRMMDLERYTRDVLAGQVTAKFAALETAVASVVQHQHDTAQLLQTLEGRLDRLAVPLIDVDDNVPAAGGPAAEDASGLASPPSGD